MNNQNISVYGIKRRIPHIAKYNIGSPVASNVVATLYENGLLELEGSGNIKEIKYSTSFAPWYDNRAKIKSVSFKKGNTINITSLNGFFYDCYNLAKIDFSNIDMTKLTDISYAFSECSSLVNLDLSSFNTSKVTTLRDTFSGCTKLANLNISTWETPLVTSLNGTFNNCSSLVNLNLAKFTTEKVVDWIKTFSGCVNLVNLNMPNVKVARAAYMNGTFANCKNLITEFTLTGGLGSSSMFNNTATIPPAKVIVNYTTAASSFVDEYIANKTPAECNIVKGVNIDL